MKTLWCAVHRWDIPTDDSAWQSFDWVMHNGWARQERIRWHYPHLRTVVYVYPYAVYQHDTGRPLKLSENGNLLEGYPEPIPLVSSNPIYPTNNRRGAWVDWTRIDIARLVAHHAPTVPKSVVGFMIDNIPEWQTELGSEARLMEHLEIVVKLLKNLKSDAWIVGNVYDGRRGLNACATVADGCYFEQTFWYWYSGSWLPEASQQRNRQRVLSVLNRKKMAVLHVPAMPKSQHPRAVTTLNSLADEAGAETLLLAEQPWQGATRKSLVGTL